MKHVGLIDAGRRLSELCREVAETREEIVIEQDGVPLVALSPLASQPATPAAESVWESVRRWEAEHPEDDVDFEPAPRFDVKRDALGDYWK